MANPITMITDKAGNWIKNSDMASVGKVACGLLMLSGAVIIAMAGNADSTEEVVETVADTVETVVEDIPAADVVIETVSEVAETITE